MGYRVSAITGLGSAVSVIVSDAAAAVAKIDKYREDGFTDIFVKDLAGKDVPVSDLISAAS